jgi:hypothetical protein
MEPTPATVAIGILRTSRHMRKLKGDEFIPSQSPVIDVIKKRGQTIMPALISSMTFNAKIVIKASMRLLHGKGIKHESSRNVPLATPMMVTLRAFTARLCSMETQIQLPAAIATASI